MINNVVDFIKAIKKFLQLININDYITEYEIDESNKIKILESSTLFKIDHELADDLEELELSLSYFIFDNEGMIDTYVRNMLLKNNIKIIKLNNDSRKGSYYLDCGSFNLIFDIV